MIDSLMGIEYDRKLYNCAHFVIDVWKRIFDIETNSLQGFLTGVGDRRAFAHSLNELKRLDMPRHGAMVLFQANRREPHVGIWYKNRVLHLTKTGVQWVDLEVAMLGFNRVRFYGIEETNDRPKSNGARDLGNLRN